jgi:exopolysaccharide biosynthesis polyprenyl glycosylphosphotransferase
VRLTDTREAFTFQVTGSLAALVARLCFPACFVVADTFGLMAAATVGHWLPGDADTSGWLTVLPGVNFVHPLLFALISLIVLNLFGFHDRLRTVLRNSELTDLYGAITVSVVLTMTVALLMRAECSTAVYIMTWIIAPPAIVTARGALRWLRRQILPMSTLTVPVLLLGESEESRRLLQRIDSVPELDLLPVKVVAGASSNLEDLRQLVQQNEIRHVIITASKENQTFVAEMAEYCQENGLRVAWLQRTFGLPMTVASLHTWDGTPVVQLAEPISQRLYETGKRAVDLACALVLLPFLLPPLLVAAIAVRLDSEGPILLRQSRIGRGGRAFNMYKFRSMRAGSEDIPEELRAQNEATGPMFKMRQDPRVTRVGRFLRKTSLDEIPQIFNVLRGHMTMVGPRPPLPREIPGYNELQRRRLMVKPGITGLWQVSGRSGLTFEEMLGMDVRYIQKRSLLLDIIILVKTVPCVISGKGAC